ncbi:MAG TPA: Rieske (2Fe-2S) protein [Polyangia bacterium]
MDRDRRLICKATLALGVGSVLPACGNAASMAMCGAGAIGVGNAADIPMDSALNVPTGAAKVGMSIFVCHDAGGFYAVDAGCTHLGCDVALKSASDLKQGFACPCHGATYDANGLTPTSPAPSPLTHYLVCGEPSGALVVDLGAIVDPKVRFKP